jgi:hypothetical protein
MASVGARFEHVAQRAFFGFDSSEIERMTERRAPLPAFSPRSAVGLVYAALWAEVEARMGPE